MARSSATGLTPSCAPQPVPLGSFPLLPSTRSAKGPLLSLARSSDGSGRHFVGSRTCRFGLRESRLLFQRYRLTLEGQGAQVPLPDLVRAGQACGSRAARRVRRQGRCASRVELGGYAGACARELGHGGRGGEVLKHCRVSFLSAFHRYLIQSLSLSDAQVKG